MYVLRKDTEKLPGNLKRVFVDFLNKLMRKTMDKQNKAG